MKQLTCEMCGSTDLVKQDGVFVCQSCGCKYSIEEAKRMMIEGTVDVQGTVKVDNSAFVQKYLANARRAKEKEDWEETEKYYNMVEQNDPDNIEAIFYSAYGKAKLTLVDNDLYKRQAAFKVLTNCISVIDEHYKVDRREENKMAIIEMAKDLAEMLVSGFVFTEWKNGYGVVTRTNKGETHSLFIALVVQFRESINNIATIDDQIYLHEALVTVYTVASACDYIKSETISELINEEREKIRVLKQKNFDAYWSEHADEKEDLEKEKRALAAKIENWNSEIASFPEAKEEERIKAKLETLQREKSALGLFKGQEKKALQAQIDSLTSDDLAKAQKCKETAIAPIQVQIDAAYERIAVIDEELSKER